MKKLAWAYGYPYTAIHTNEDLAGGIVQTLSQEGPMICEVFVTRTQVFEPKSATKRLPDGTLVSAPLEDLAPFLPDEELQDNMRVPMVKKV